VKYVLRLLFFWIKLLFVVLVVVAIAGSAFFIAMDVTNIALMSGDALKARADYVILGDLYEGQELNKFFTDEFLSRDELIQDSPYTYYAVTDYEQKVQRSWIWCWPWQNKVSFTITQHVYELKGDLKAEHKTEEQIEKGQQVAPPAWKDSVYTIRCERIDDRWLITDIVFVEEAEPLPTPTPSPSSEIEEEDDEEDEDVEEDEDAESSPDE
jgi:hypothetical protein